MCSSGYPDLSHLHVSIKIYSSLSQSHIGKARLVWRLQERSSVEGVTLWWAGKSALSCRQPFTFTFTALLGSLCLCDEGWTLKASETVRVLCSHVHPHRVRGFLGLVRRRPGSVFWHTEAVSRLGMVWPNWKQRGSSSSCPHGEHKIGVSGWNVIAQKRSRMVKRSLI